MNSAKASGGCFLPLCLLQGFPNPELTPLLLCDPEILPSHQSLILRLPEALSYPSRLQPLALGTPEQPGHRHCQPKSCPEQQKKQEKGAEFQPA